MAAVVGTEGVSPAFISGLITGRRGGANGPRRGKAKSANGVHATGRQARNGGQRRAVSASRAA